MYLKGRKHLSEHCFITELPNSQGKRGNALGYLVSWVFCSIFSYQHKSQD